MSFSASPLIPGQRTGEEGDWAALAQLAVEAVTQAIPQIPAAGALEVGEPGQDPAAVTGPEPVGAAIVASISGGPEGSVLLVVGQELVAALKDTPFGDLEPAKAMQPALEAIAANLGGRLDGEPTAIEAADAHSVLEAGTSVTMQLSTAGAVSVLVGISLRAMPESGPSGTRGNSRSWGIEMLRDVEMEVTCELGRTRMSVRSLLALAPGDVVELDRLAGSPADLLVNGTLLARGEVVVVDESFGLRITEIVTRDAT
ncbi:flagellar motor switch protein FliN [Spongisporangium articulatum]|uniref:Flagellar motor switch protein FliN n=1 Tax=Spongisporangium articulatum TaxID=3362603 RepID=A0ABW8AHP0_9ACTN